MAPGNQPLNEVGQSQQLEQIREYWMKMFAFLLWETHGTEEWQLKAERIAEFTKQFPAEGGPCVYTHGHPTYMTFKIVSMQAAKQIQAHSESMTGHA